MTRSMKLRVREVSLGRRSVSNDINNEHLEKLLEYGRNLRKSKACPIKCRVMLYCTRKMSKHEIETINRNRKRMQQEGQLPSSVPVEEVSSYVSNWDPYSGIIPSGGITKEGYVKEVWIQCYPESIQIGNQSYQVIDPYVHDTKHRIRGFMLEPNNLIQLLPSAKIVVKYFREPE